MSYGPSPEQEVKDAHAALDYYHAGQAGTVAARIDKLMERVKADALAAVLVWDSERKELLARLAAAEER